MARASDPEQIIRALALFQQRPRAAEELAATLGVSRATGFRLLEHLARWGVELELVDYGGRQRHRIADYGPFDPHAIDGFAEQLFGNPGPR